MTLKLSDVFSIGSGDFATLDGQQKDGQMDVLKDGYTVDRQTDRQTDGQIQIDRQTGRYRNKLIEIDRQINGCTDRQIDSLIDRQIDSQTAGQIDR